MPVIEKPKDREPLVGRGTQILIGGPLVHQLRKWKKRNAAPPTKEEEG